MEDAARSAAIHRSAATTLRQYATTPAAKQPFGDTPILEYTFQLDTANWTTQAGARSFELTQLPHGTPMTEAVAQAAKAAADSSFQRAFGVVLTDPASGDAWVGANIVEVGDGPSGNTMVVLDPVVSAVVNADGTPFKLEHQK